MAEALPLNISTCCLKLIDDILETLAQVTFIKNYEDSEYDDDPNEESITYGDKTLQTQIIFVVETDGVVMVECEICHKNFKKRGLKTHLNAYRKKECYKQNIYL